MTVEGGIEFTLLTKVTFGSGSLTTLGEEKVMSKRACENVNAKTNPRRAGTEEIQALYHQAFIVK